MSVDRLLLQAVLESPDDDGLRLIYADWLEEHGQSDRAEFIRVQIRLAEIGLERKRYDEAFVKGSRQGILVAIPNRSEKSALPEVGDRIDVDAFLMRGRSEEKLTGLVVVEALGDTDNNAHYWFLLKRDKHSKPYPKELAETLRRRERELLTTDNRARWTQPYPVEYHFTIEAFRRGFVEHISCTGRDWMTYGSFILWEQPVQEVTLTTLPGYGFLWLFRQQNGLISWPGSESDHSLRLLETGWPQIRKWNLP